MFSRAELAHVLDDPLNVFDWGTGNDAMAKIKDVAGTASGLLEDLADALAKHLSGSVELEFTVSPSGEVTDIKIQAADPPGVFDQAAINALSQSHYQPVLRDGVAIAQRVRVRLRFKP